MRRHVDGNYAQIKHSKTNAQSTHMADIGCHPAVRLHHVPTQQYAVLHISIDTQPLYFFVVTGARATGRARASTGGEAHTATSLQQAARKSVTWMQTARRGMCAMAACASVWERSAARARAASLAPVKRVARQRRAA